MQSPQNGSAVPIVVQQQIMSQQELLNQQMLQMQQMQQRLHQSQPVLTQQQYQQQPQQHQRPMSQQMHYSQLQNGVVIGGQPPPPAQQNGVQYVQLTNGMLVPVQQQAIVTQQSFLGAQQPVEAPTNVAGSYPTVVTSSTMNSTTKNHYSSIEESRMQLQKSADAVDNSKNAQKQQMNLSKDAGLKCSRI